MTQDEMRKIAAEQKAEMEKHKWLESEKAGFDLGQAALLDWIGKHAAKWRKAYEHRTHSRNEEGKKDK